MANPHSMIRRLATLIWVIGLGTAYSVYLRDQFSSDSAQEQAGLPIPDVDLLVHTVLNKPLDDFIDKSLG